jgi:hypothetical protein
MFTSCFLPPQDGCAKFLSKTCPAVDGRGLKVLGGKTAAHRNDEALLANEQSPSPPKTG